MLGSPYGMNMDFAHLIRFGKGVDIIKVSTTLAEWMRTAMAGK
jgi:hypothetical protein